MATEIEAQAAPQSDGQGAEPIEVRRDEDGYATVVVPEDVTLFHVQKADVRLMLVVGRRNVTLRVVEAPESLIPAFTRIDQVDLVAGSQLVGSTGEKAAA